MSYQKKSVILQQLEQAIRRKAEQKPRNKQQMSRVLQSSIQKKKNAMKSTTNKDNRLSSTNKNPKMPSTNSKVLQKPISIFNNDQSAMPETSDARFKKTSNRRFDKLVSLVHYMISSSQKVVKYISSTNFEAQFALKLYRSDKDNLENQLKNLTVEDIVQAHRGQEKQSIGKMDSEYRSLIDQNSRLKKDILILQKQAERFHLRSNKSQEDHFIVKGIQKQLSKVKEMLRKVMPFECFKNVIDILQKQSKFQAMSFKCQDNSKKIAQIQLMIDSLEKQRLTVIQGLIKGRSQPKTQRNGKIAQIQEEKQNLKKEMQNMKFKLMQLMEDSRCIQQTQIVKKNAELVNEKLKGVVQQLDHQKLTDASSQEYIAVIVQTIKQLNSKIGRIDVQNNMLKHKIKQFESQKLQLVNYKAQTQNSYGSNQKKMQNMLLELHQCRLMIGQMQEERQHDLQEIKLLKQNIHNKQQDIRKKQQIIKVLQKDNGIKGDSQLIIEGLKIANFDLKKDVQGWMVNCQANKRTYQDKIEALITQKNILQNQLIAKSKQYQNDQQQNEHYQHQISMLRDRQRQLIEMVQDRQNSYRSLAQKYQKVYETITDLQLQLSVSEKEIGQLQKKIKQIDFERVQLKQQVHKKQVQKQKLQANKGYLQAENSDLKTRIQIYKDKEQKSTAQSAYLIEQQSKYQQQITKLKQENQSLNSKVKTIQQDMISNNYAAQQLSQIKAQNTTLNQQLNQLRTNNQQNFAKIQLANQKIFEIVTQRDSLLLKTSQLSKRSLSSTLYIEQTTQENQNLIEKLALLIQQKQSLQARMQNKITQFEEEVANLDNKNELLETENIKIKNQHKQLQKTHQTKSLKFQSIQQTIRSLQQEKQQLHDKLQNIDRKDKQHLIQLNKQKVIIANLQQSKQQMLEQIETLKQAREDQANIHSQSIQQYIRLLKLILRGLNLEPEDYQNKNTLQELLELGSKKTLEMRKRQRDEESNQRRHDRKDYGKSSNEKTPQEMELSVPLFGPNSVALFKQQALLESKAKKVFQGQKQASEQQEVRQIFQNQAQQYDQSKVRQVFQSEALAYDQSNVRQVFQSQALAYDQANIQKILQSKAEAYDQSKVKNLFQSQGMTIFQSKVTKVFNSETQPQIQSKVQRVFQSKQQFILQSKVKKTFQQNPLKKQEDKIQLLQSKFQQQNAFSDIEGTNQLDDFGDLQQSSINKSMLSEQQVPLKENIQNLDQFNQIHEQMNDSILSNQPTAQRETQENNNIDFVSLNRQNIQSKQYKQQTSPKNDEQMHNNQQKIVFPKILPFPTQENDQDDQLLDKSQEYIQPQRIPQDNPIMSEENSQFQKYNISAVNSKKSQDQHRKSQNQGESMGLDEFDDMKESMNESMISQKQQANNQPLSASKTSKDQDLGLSQFDDVKQSMSGSMISEKQQTSNQLNQFAQAGPENKEEEQADLGLDEFGDAQQNINNSILSNNNEKLEENMQGEDFCELQMQLPGKYPQSNQQGEVLYQQQQNMSDQDYQLPSEEPLTSLPQLAVSKVEGQTQQHGFSDFGDLSQMKMSDSMLSAGSKKLEQGNNLDEFDEYKSQKMNDSVVSDAEPQKRAENNILGDNFQDEDQQANQ